MEHHVYLNAANLASPIYLLRIRLAMYEMGINEILKLETKHREAVQHVGAFCKMCNVEILDKKLEGTTWVFYLKKKGDSYFGKI